MTADAEGFLYPSVDASVCVNCHLCEKVCPALLPAAGREPLATFAFNHGSNEIRRQSSSGGAFSALAQRTIENGGVVFGARWTETLDVEHVGVTGIAELEALRGSKYVQSNTQGTFCEVMEALSQERQVMYVGTPCQIKALRRFVGNARGENLLLVDFVCHGTSSPAVWHYYIGHLQDSLAARAGEKVRVTHVSMRDKRHGWKNYNVTLGYESASGRTKGEITSHSSDNPFIRAHGGNLILRPSCSRCFSKAGRSGSDITLADFWGIENVLPAMNDDKGTSLVLVNTERGMKALAAIGAQNMQEVEVKAALAQNRSWQMPSAPHPKRDIFMAAYDKAASFRWLVIRYIPYTIRGLIRKLKRDLCG